MLSHRQQLVAVFAMVLVGALLLVALFWLVLPRDPLHTVSFGNQAFRMRVADTQEERTQGLSGTKPLKAKQGMLFVFEENGFWGIWMKDMKYPIDIVWLNEQKSVVHIEQHITPETYPATFIPPVPARYVLELEADATEKYGIKQGDQATFRAP